MTRAPLLFSLLCSLLIAAMLLSLLLGPLPIAVRDVVQVFGSAANDTVTAVVLQARLPRAVLAALVGAVLAQTGVVMQGLFRNPLADPGVLGVSSGSALGAALAISVLPAALAVWATPLAAFLGALLVALTVRRLADSANGTSFALLILAGIAISALAGAGLGLLSYFASDDALRAITLWQMGALGGASPTGMAACLAALVISAVVFQHHASALNVLLLGEAEAHHLGIHVERVKTQLILACALAVGTAVAAAGIIGFIGIVIPHLVRLVTGADHRRLLPLSALCGAILLVAGDLLGRNIIQPAELPVGLITALLGTPFFLGLLLRQRQQGAD